MMPIPENGGGAARGDEHQRALALSLALELRKAREVGALLLFFFFFLITLEPRVEGCKGLRAQKGPRGKIIG